MLSFERALGYLRTIFFWRGSICVHYFVNATDGSARLFVIGPVHKVMAQ